MNTDKSSAPAMYFWGTPNNYAVKPSPSCDLKNMPSFSIFRRPITNKHPYQVVNLIDVFNYIISDYAKDRTNELRTIKDDRYRRQYKANKFDYCTFSGIFSVRTDKAIIQHSGLICLDFDHLKDVEAIFEALKEDTYFETLLLFRSPSGNGLKWVISFHDSYFRYGKDGESYSDYQVRFFAGLYNYIFNHYDVEVDRSCRNLSRACFLPHDPAAYLNPSLL
ncbi:MAG: virulence protein E [Bacteroidales bacterium]|nr:virulence protein E [Bacteroidales bacterium]